MIGNRIIVLGCTGSGKSTFCKKLHQKTGLPLFHLDNLWWKADRSHVSRDEFDSKLEQILRGEKWIVDGDYSRTYQVRFRACDTVIFLDFSQQACMRGIAERVGETRTDIPWTEQTLDPLLVKEVLDYEKENRPAVLSLIDRYPEKTALIFNSRSEADGWLRTVARSGVS